MTHEMIVEAIIHPCSDVFGFGSVILFEFSLHKLFRVIPHVSCGGIEERILVRIDQFDFGSCGEVLGSLRPEFIGSHPEVIPTVRGILWCLAPTSVSHVNASKLSGPELSTGFTPNPSFKVSLLVLGNLLVD